ncbi:methyltransferase [Gordonia sp. ABSL11-1]|uniref:methyltransferase n=1 Tax=Gordonia sp. ABSL11-1 TaxID=3053924 RepID=UPI0025726431|nr:methyltransferase [Gordonia sp. ABSL11-1]MDL9946535.1 methyltransferase [Gordonia sp. ABSL11-1]
MTSVADRDDPTTAPLFTSTTPTISDLLDHGKVYRPQHDSDLLVEAVQNSDHAVGAAAADLCTGSGVIARAIAHLGARSVVAVDASDDAVRVARALCTDSADRVAVRHGDVATFRGTFDLVTCNPPYVPSPPDGRIQEPGLPRAAWEAGINGRAVLDVVCSAAADLLKPGGNMYVVQSEFAGIEASVTALRSSGLVADVVVERHIPFGPVLSAHAAWLEANGRLEKGRRVELLAVIRAHKRPVPTRPQSR